MWTSTAFRPSSPRRGWSWTIRSELLLVALLLAGCDCSEPSAPPPDPDEGEETSTPEERARTVPTEERPEPSSGPVTLTYAWPDGARAQVSGERRLDRSVGNDLEARLRYRLDVERAGDETVLSTGQLSIERIEAELLPDQVSASGVIDLYFPSLATLPTRVERLTDHEATRHVIDDAFEEAVPSSARAAPAWHQLEALWVDRLALLRATASKWDWLVAGLVDREMILGETGALEGSSTAALTAQPVQTTGEITAVSTLPCFEGDAPDRCVWIESETEMAEEAAAQMAEGLEVSDLSMTMRSVIVTEVDTLLPHYATLVSERTFTVGEGEAAQEVTETETKVFRFRWERDTIR